MLLTRRVHFSIYSRESQKITRNLNMSARARRAQQRAANAPPIPETPPRQVQRNNDPMLSNLDKYNDEEEFISMLQRIGVNQAGIGQLNSDDFDTMKVLVEQYKDDISEFVSYLKTINKSSSPVRYSPVVSNRIIAVLHYFIQSVTCFHKIPDISIINREEAMM